MMSITNANLETIKNIAILSAVVYVVFKADDFGTWINNLITADASEEIAARNDPLYGSITDMVNNGTWTGW